MKREFIQEDDPIIDLENRLLEINARLKYFRLPGIDVETYTLGRTGVGKSTLISCLTEGQIEWGRSKGDKGQFWGNAPSNCPKIGNQVGRSQTTNPDEYDVPAVGRMKDNPGLGDTRGPEQDIINSYLIANQFQKDKKIKLLIMLQMNDFVGEKGANILKLLNVVAGIFCKEDHRLLAKSCLIIVSKIPQDCVTDEDLETEIKQIYQKHGSADLSRCFTLEILKNNGVVIFPQPQNTHILSINPQSINLIRHKIALLPPYLLNTQASIQLTPTSKNYLSKLAFKTSADLQKNTQTLANTIKNNMTNIDTSSLHSMKNGLKLIHNTKAIITQAFQKPTLSNIASNLIHLKLPEVLIKSTIKQLHKLDVCQSLNTLHITKRKKNEFIEKIMKPVIDSELELKRKIAGYETNLMQTKALEKVVMDERQSYMEMQNAMMMGMVNSMEENQNERRRMMSEFNQDLINLSKKNTENRLQENQNLRQAFSQSKWQNYRVQITTEKRCCSIM